MLAHSVTLEQFTTKFKYQLCLPI